MRISFLIVFVLHMFQLDAQEPEFLPVAQPGDEGFLKSELIYHLNEKPTPECHASTLVEIPGGIAAAWFGGTYERHPDVGIWLSFNTTGQWSKPVEVANGYQHDTLTYPTWNPVLFQPPSGPLMLFYKVGPNPRDWWGMLTTSDDDGRSWSKPIKLGEDGVIGHLLGPVKNKPIALSNGALLCPSSSEKNDPQLGTVWKVHFEYTPDLGKTWKVIGPINDGIAFDAIQPSILTYENDRMQILCRTRQGQLGESWSTDGGQSWATITASTLPNPNAGTDAVTLQDGRQLLVYNHTSKGGPFPRGRNMLNVAISEDGQHWQPIYTLERQEGEFSYPAVIQAADGLVHITYTYLRRSIKYAVLDPNGF